MLLLVLLVSTAVMEYSTGQVMEPNLLYGGSMTFYPLPSTNETFEVEFRIKVSATKCINLENSTRCGDPNNPDACGIQTYNNTAVIDMTTGPPRCLQELVTRRELESDRPFTLIFAPANSIWFYYGWNGSIPFEMRAKVNVGIRSDTGRPNTGPIATMIYTLRIQPNCGGFINLTVHDPEGDRIRCSYEDHHTDPTGFTLHPDNCMLWYDLKGSVSQPPPFQLKLEDFPKTSITLTYSDGYSVFPTTRALSSVPLKFIVFVEQQNATSCCTGDFMPLILNIPGLVVTPPNGDIIPASQGNLEPITVYALFRLSRFHNFLISGPSGIRKTTFRQQSVAMFAITWTPSDNEENRQFPICFVVETMNSTNMNKKYQSNLRCVIIDVRGPNSTTPTTTTMATTTNPNPCSGRLSGYFENPADRNTYFQCSHGRAFLLRCASGLEFSSSCTCCDFPRTDTNTPSSTFCEKLPNGLYENQLDSNSYFICFDHITFPEQCQQQLVYGYGCIGCERRNI